MEEFFRFVRSNLRDRRYLVGGLLFAFLSGSSLAAGLLSMIPILRLILDPQGQNGSLQDWARDLDQGNAWLRMPEWIIDRLPTDRLEGVALTFGLLLLLAIFGGVCSFLHHYCGITLAVRTIARVRAEAFRHVLNLPMSQVHREGASRYVSRIIRDTISLENGMIALTAKAVTQVVKGGVSFIVALVVGGWIIWMALLIVPLFAWLLRRFGMRIRRRTRGALKGQEALLRMTMESVQGIRVVKANTAEELAAQRFEERNEHVVREVLRARTARALSSPVIEVIAIAAVSGLALIAVREIILGRLLVDRFLLSLGALAIAGTSVKSLVNLTNKFHGASAPAERIREMLEEEQEDSRSGPTADLARHMESIEFDSVLYTYPGADRPAVDGVSLRIEHRERVAIVGPNGCGKTTLISLLPLLLVPEAGCIRIDGTDVQNVSLGSLRSQIGVVTQDVVLFSGTIAENIAFGLPGADRAAIIEAATRGHAHDFIEQLPQGYDTDVLEQAALLSGGQRQRLAIARAIISSPSILLLDEATSQVDAESETQINSALSEFCRGRTALVIAHRLSTVLHADRIVVMEDGRIVDQGTHHELLDRCELYHRLNQSQLVVGP